MDRTANIIASFADQVRKGAGRHLYFEFSERSYWSHGFHRERCVDPKFRLSLETKEQIRCWVAARDGPDLQSIRIQEGQTDVVISWKPQTVPHFRTFCRMPPVAYHVDR